MRWFRYRIVQDTGISLVLLLSELPAQWHASPGVLLGEIVIAAAVAMRRWTTFVAGACFAVAFVAQPMLTPEPPEGQLAIGAILLLGYAFGSRYRWPLASCGVAILLAGTLGHEAFESSDYAFAAALTMFAWLCGVLVHAARTESQLLLRRAVSAAAEREAAVAAARRVERSRLARELHDIVSHGVTAMTIQAGAAHQVLVNDPAAAHAVLKELRDVGESTIAELHDLLQLLRAEDAMAPSGHLGLRMVDVDGLVARACSSGQQITLRRASSPADIADPVQLSVYRIVQEGLTNARRYNPDGDVRIGIDVTNLAVTVAIDDTCPTGTQRGAPESTHGGGLGLLGLQERVELLGGILTAHPTATGFTLHALLPLTRSAIP